MRRGWVVMMALLFCTFEARATECGDARRAADHLGAAAAAEQALHHAGPAHDARGQADQWDKKVAKACAERRVTLSALPLAYLTSAPGQSHIELEIPASFSLSLSTRAGAAAGIVFREPAHIDIPAGTRWSYTNGGVAVVVARDAVLTVNEPKAGLGQWRIDLGPTPPQILPLAALTTCAAGGAAVAHLDRADCQLLTSIVPAPAPAVPGRGRAVYVGEWQYGWHSGLELGDEELARANDAAATDVVPRVDATLGLSAPLAGISDGKRLSVTFETHAVSHTAGARISLGHECSGDDEKCEAVRFGVAVWFDRVFGVPFIRSVGSSLTQASAAGKIADRLARPMAGQRVMLVSGDRKIVTISDDVGEYRFIQLAGGKATVFPVGKAPTDRPGNEESKQVDIGIGETKVPMLFVNKRFD